MALHDSSARTGNFLTIKHHAICRELSPAPVTDEEKQQAIADKFQELTVENPSDIRPDGSKGTVQKWVRKFGSLDGTIVGLEWYDRKHNISGKEVRFVGLKMKIKDEAETYILDLPFGNRAYDVFTRIMEDIDYTKPIEISVWHDKKNGNATAVLWKQNGESLKWRYTKEWNSNIVRALGALQGYDQLAIELHEALESGVVPDAMIEAVAKAGFVIAPPPVHNPLAKPAWNFDAQRAFLWHRMQNIVIPKILELHPKFDDPVPEETDDVSFVPGIPSTPTPAPAAAPAEVPAAAPPVQEFTGPQPPAEVTSTSGWVPPGAGPTDTPF